MRTPQEINALIRLLDDPDEDIYGHIKQELKSFGEDVINSYLKLKNKELDEFERVERFDKKAVVTDWEKNNTLDC